MQVETDQYIRVTTGEVHWQVVPEYEDTFLGPKGLRLEEWLRTGAARVVKSRPHRVVYRVDLPGFSFHIKHNRVNNIRSWLREKARPSKARLEYQKIMAVAARGIPSIEPLAIGECRGRFGAKGSYLITRTLEGAGPLDSFIETVLPDFPLDRQTIVRQRLAVALGEFMARLHEGGLIHNDLHCGNLLIRLEAEEYPRLYLIDPHGIRMGKPLDWQASRLNLSMLNRWLVSRSSRTDRLRFWRAYFAARPRARFPERPSTELAKEMESSAWRDLQAFWRHRDLRFRSNNRYFRKVRSRTVSGHVVGDLDLGLLARLLSDPDEPFRHPEVIVRKSSRTSTVTEFDLVVEGEARRLMYKRFRLRSWKEPWQNLIRHPPALRSWARGHGLRERGMPTARPLAMFYRRRWGLWQEGYLLTEKVQGAIDLHHFLTRVDALSPRGRREAMNRGIEQVAQLVRDLHARQLCHRDLKAVNILVSKDLVSKSTENCAAVLIDLVGVRQYDRLARHRAVQNLARLHASFHGYSGLTRTDRTRFLRVYLRWGLHGREGWKQWWRDIEAATTEKIARNSRVGRPLA